MNKTRWMAALGVTGLALAGLSAPAAAGSNVSFGITVGVPAYGVYVPPPPVAPPIVYAPAPVYYHYTPPPPRVYYAPQPYYYPALVYHHPGRHKGWNQHHYRH